MENKFTIIKEVINDKSILRILGSLDAHTAPKLEKEIENLVTDGCYKVIVNFKNLDYISSAGLGVFMSQIETIRQKDGDLKLTEMQEKVFSVFDLLGFPMLFNITSSESEALANFSKARTDG